MHVAAVGLEVDCMLVGVIIGILVLIFLVVIHELGHAFAAKRNGVEVKEFAVGFPPTIYKKKVKNSPIGKDVIFKINLLPLGGYVRLKGEYDSSKVKGGYGRASYWVKTKILVAGVLVNWVFAAIVFAALSLHGLPKLFDNQFSVPSDTQVVQVGESRVLVVDTVPGSIARESGLLAGDQIVEVDGRAVESADQVVTSISGRKSELEVGLIRDGERVEVAIPRVSGGESTIGVQIGQTEASDVIRSTWSAPIVGVGFAGQLTVETLKGLYQMIADFLVGLFSKSDSEASSGSAQGVVGPVGILGEIFPSASRAGLSTLAFLTGVISLSLAIMNLLPIPGLDGGRWLTMSLFRVSGRALTREREEVIQGVGVLMILGLVVAVTIADIGRML